MGTEIIGDTLTFEWHPISGGNGYCNTPNQNYNKILKCDWLSPA